MPDLNRRLPRLDASRFAMTPRAEVPRSTFVTTHSVKTTFQTGYLVPIEVEEVLPGDTHQGAVTIFARMATMVFPVMDRIILETFFFFVPSRLLWTNWRKMMGERLSPADSISYTVPRFNTYEVQPCTLADYMGIPGIGQIAAGSGLPVNALPFRAYNKIFNEWFRDQNIQLPVPEHTGDGPETTQSDYSLKRRNKRPDYFTSALPWPLKGGAEVTIPMAGNARVIGLGSSNSGAAAGSNVNVIETSGSVVTYPKFKELWQSGAGPGPNYMRWDVGLGRPEVYADLSTTTGQTINAIRLAFQTQRLLERDARSGTRYTELLRAHFGVDSEDSRLQRPEYVGGGRTDINTQAIPQTSSTGITGGTGVLGSLGAAATASDQHTYTVYAREHGYIIGLVHVGAELTYQQGLRRMWTRSTRYDFYWPAFAHLGEQIIRNDEIYAQNTTADAGVFGYQERWAEYRHRPSMITGLFKSTSSGNIDEWHLAQQFASLPTLTTSFIEDAPPMSRALAAGIQADNMQVIFDSVFKIKSTRAMPMFSIPGMLDRF